MLHDHVLLQKIHFWRKNHYWDLFIWPFQQWFFLSTLMVIKICWLARLACWRGYTALFIVGRMKEALRHKNKEKVTLHQSWYEKFSFNQRRHPEHQQNHVIFSKYEPQKVSWEHETKNIKKKNEMVKKLEGYHGGRQPLVISVTVFMQGNMRKMLCEMKTKA